ncbi:MAG: adenylyltransferase/cytidyltransferase family protein [Nanoarchaeota archaeon]|nr:adenylyltransferase/cytidyltransferase family protein [Nanoarchaeota archaeon]MBU1135769.1 adenylyltransferase/cytidyltransferase family protein [Nanoarchaeota archaeon]MBU2520237.1 adenylyltransferase/cytidyltransferase family protein [Nanoarchaeota archaeon]
MRNITMKKVLVGGVFNILHPGHVWFLKKAKSYGEFLVVVVAHDNTVRKNKEYLLFPAKERKRLLEHLDFVDKVVIGNKDDMFETVKKECPDIIVLGYDQKIDKEMIDKKIRIIKLKRKYRDYSTKKLLGK